MILKAMIKKEFTEMIRNYKIFTIPILFMLLGALQPITFYYLPDILKMATLTEGAVIQIPVPSPSETIYSVYSQFNQVGLLILVLISMGAVVNEVKNGVAETIVVKPIPISNYIISKWIAYFSLTILSTLSGLLLGKYYTTQLIGSISWTVTLRSATVFILYLLFFISLNLLLSSIVNSSIVAGGITILTAVVLGIVSTLFNNIWYLPTYLIKINQAILFEQSINYLWINVILTVLFILAMFYLSVYFFRKKEL